jgi:PAB-dependent poly(A)-specific ribonuclease subunit 2
VANAAPSRQATPSRRITSVEFDSFQDLLWTGDESGRIASYFGPELNRYTSFHGHSGPVTSFLTNDRCLVSLSSDCIRLHNRRGLAKQTVKDKELMTELTGMAFSSKGTSEVVAVGNQQKIVRINLDRGTIASSQDHAGGITQIKRGSHNIALGRNTGAVDLIDPTSLQVVRSFNAHSGAIADMDCRQYTIVTCGYSTRKNSYVADPLVNVFDTRTMKPLPPLAFPAGAAFVRLHPKLSNLCIVGSHGGQIQFLDIGNPANVTLIQANTASFLTGIEVSSSGNYMAFRDDDGFVQLWTNTAASGSDTGFTEFSGVLEFPTAQVPPLSFSVEDLSMPLSSIGMPYYKEELLSSWSDPNFIFKTGMPPPPVDAEILAHASNSDFIRQAPYSDSYPKRNQAVPYVSLENMRRSSLTVPKFKSEKSRTGEVDDRKSLFNENEDDLASGKIPKVYRRHEIKYSKFGINDFDFDFYNQTVYSGLETQLPNAYCNSLLQLYRHSKVFYNFAMASLTYDAAANDKYLLSELGLLFDMLHKANGANCQASNFLNMLNSMPQAGALGLLHDDLSQKTVNEGILIQGFNRFLIERLAHDEHSISDSQHIDEIIRCQLYTSMRYSGCGTTSSRMSHVSSLELSKLGNSFIENMINSLERISQTRAWCEKCKKYQMVTAIKSIRTLPKLLNIKIPVNDRKNDRKIWSRKDWPVTEFRVDVNNDKILLEERGSTKYQLLGMVIEVTNSSGSADSHLVTIVKINGNWYLFNDFLVKEIGEEEALDFSMPWKTPIILLYEQFLPDVEFDYSSWIERLDTSILFRDHFIAGTRAELRKEYTLLTKEEAPYPGMLVAMDAEFVLLQHEETEISSDGTKSFLKPRSLSLARVSVVRGEGLQEGVTFIDDYIANTDYIVDYLTEFSGIEPGDLDPATSKRGLVSLQTSYRRLWLLLNLGCVFIGHGLENDFRTINIQVPSSQVIDTSEIFYVAARQRKLSLKFLAWYLLDEQVQTGNHDSIEDARTALHLYRKSQQLINEGQFESTLNAVYSDGHKFNFKPPAQ